MSCRACLSFVLGGTLFLLSPRLRVQLRTLDASADCQLISHWPQIMRHVPPARVKWNEEPLNDISTKALSRLSLKELQVRCDALGVRIEPSIDDQLAAIALQDVNSVKQGRMRQSLHGRVILAHEEIRHADEELRLAAREGIRNTSGYANVGVLPFARKPYEASVWRGGKLVHLGNFGSAEKAAQCVALSPEGRAVAATMSADSLGPSAGLFLAKKLFLASESATGDVASEVSIGSRSAAGMVKVGPRQWPASPPLFLCPFWAARHSQEEAGPLSA